MLHEKLPDPVPWLVLLVLIVGLVTVPQQTPLAVTGLPPSVEIFPPDTAEFIVFEVISFVVNVANCHSPVENVTWFPYPVPSSFVAYALT